MTAAGSWGTQTAAVIPSSAEGYPEPYPGKLFNSALNEKVVFKIPTTRYLMNSILCVVLHSGTTKWTSDVGGSSGL